MDNLGRGDDGRTVHNTVSGDAVIHGHVVQASVINSLHLATSEPRPVPRQLPPRIGLFVNRTRELTELTHAMEASRLISVSGLGGVGKTQLVPQWIAALESDPFPDGHLYADLTDGRRDGSVDVAAVLRDFLLALGEDNDRLPSTLNGLSREFRSVTAGLRLLVVVDNVQHAPEVRPLVPGGGHLLVLSRRRLPSLEIDGATCVTVDPLDEQAGVELIRHWRHTAAPEAAAHLSRMCGGSPLALRAAGRQLLERSHVPLEDVVRDLGGDSGWLRGGDDEESTWGVFDRVVSGFPDHTRALYLLLGSLPGTTFTATAATAAGAERFDEALADLLATHLAVAHRPTAGQEPDRFRLHDVVRAHARAHAESAVPEERRTSALRQLAAYYVEFSAHADRLVLGDRQRLQPAPSGTAPFADAAEALAWLDAERANLLELLRTAAAHDWHDPVWRLCESLWALYHSRKYYTDWIESHRLGVTAAQWAPRPDVEIRLRNQLARAHMGLDEGGEAHAELDRAEELFGLVAETWLHGVIWETRGLLSLKQGDAEAAVDLFTRALRANEGDRHGVAVQSYNLAQALVAAGHPRRAVDLLDSVLAATPEDDAMRMRIGIVLGRAHQALGAYERAVEVAIDAAVRAHGRKQYAKLNQALVLTAELADQVRDSPLRQACLDKLAELGSMAGGAAPDGPQP
ncbi:tetratricopeptide repeat protein [Streptomyces acidicola]|uniref:tetratricopeptide repeat protein n=1 Tax=Streptomyces acidicola TaxID=2596892 RepID=UPI003805D90B